MTIKYGTFTYSCKKTGQVVPLDIDNLPDASKKYFMFKGAREYFDNYHASETMKSHNNDAAKLAEAVTPLVIEARDRVLVGDVPGTSGAVYDPVAIVMAATGCTRDVAEKMLAQTKADAAAVVETAPEKKRKVA